MDECKLGVGKASEEGKNLIQLHFRRRSHKWKFKAMSQTLNGLVDGQLSNSTLVITQMQRDLQIIGLEHMKRNNKACN